MPTLILIDASSIIHRAFHALPNLATTKGFPTGAVLGFVRMLLKVLKEKAPDRVGVVFDAKGPTFRHELDPDYKANRPPADPELTAQFPVIKDIAAAFGLKCLERPGFEADDIIATLTRLGAEAGDEVVIVSSDKDLMQLLGPGVTMWDTMKDRVFDEAAVVERFGVGPEKLADAFGLIGDSSDNIPGVPGIGPKIAGQLIAEYGDLENLLVRAEEIKQPKRRQNLIDFAEQARLAKRLFTLQDAMDLDLTLDDLAPAEPDTERLKEIFTDLEMKSLLAELNVSTEKETARPAAAPVRALAPGPELDAFLDRAREVGRAALALSLDKPQPMRGKIVGVGLAVADEAVMVSDEGWPAALERLLSDPKTAKVAFNLKAAKVALGRVGIELAGLDFDVFIADYLLHPGRRSYDPVLLAREHLGLELPAGDPAREAAAAWRLYEALAGKLTEIEVAGVFNEIEMPLVPVLAEMEAAGVAVDPVVLDRLSRDLGRRLEKLHQEIIEAAGEEFNPLSPQQLGVILFEKLGLPRAKKTKTGYSTNVDVLEGLRDAHPLPGLILDFRQLTKLKSTYVDALAGLIHPETGRIHTTFNQTVTATGRLSSSEPNLQNIPIRTAEGRSIRRAFVAEEGALLLSADYSQIELRFLAHYCQDPALVSAFVNGEDIHTQTAAKVFDVMPGFVDDEMRRQAKVINFGLIYGQTPYGLSQELKISTAEAAKFIEAYFRRFAKVKSFLDQVIEKARSQGYVTTLWGRKRFIPDLKSKNAMKRRFAERMAVNTVFQGSAADLIKIAMIKAAAALKEANLPARMILQVHDELVLEVEKSAAEECAALITEVMENAAQLKVPLEVGVGLGANWDEAH